MALTSTSDSYVKPASGNWMSKGDESSSPYMIRVFQIREIDSGREASPLLSVSYLRHTRLVVVSRLPTSRHFRS